MDAAERGSAPLEFLIASVALFVPLVALAVTVTDITTASFAATAAARQGVRAFARAESVPAGQQRIAQVSELALADYGLAPQTAQWDITCTSSPCLRRGNLVTVNFTLNVPLRFIPSLPGIAVPPLITVSRSATARVSLTSVNR